MNVLAFLFRCSIVFPSKIAVEWLIKMFKVLWDMRLSTLIERGQDTKISDDRFILDGFLCCVNVAVTEWLEIIDHVSRFKLPL
jgi:hypothetical protein